METLYLVSFALLILFVVFVVWYYYRVMNLLAKARPPLLHKAVSGDYTCHTVGQGLINTGQSNNPYICKMENAAPSPADPTAKPCVADIPNNNYCYMYNTPDGTVDTSKYGPQGDQNLNGFTCTVEGITGVQGSNHYTCMKQTAPPSCNQDVIDAGGMCWVKQ